MFKNHQRHISCLAQLVVSLAVDTCLVFVLRVFWKSCLKYLHNLSTWAALLGTSRPHTAYPGPLFAFIPWISHCFALSASAVPGPSSILWFGKMTWPFCASPRPLSWPDLRLRCSPDVFWERGLEGKESESFEAWSGCAFTWVQHLVIVQLGMEACVRIAPIGTFKGLTMPTGFWSDHEVRGQFDCCGIFFSAEGF